MRQYQQRKKGGICCFLRQVNHDSSIRVNTNSTVGRESGEERESVHVKSKYFSHPPQGNSTNYYSLTNLTNLKEACKRECQKHYN